MKRIASSPAISIALLALALGLAVLGRPRDWWLTQDQQADRLLAEGEFSAAAELYTDPLRQGAAYYRGGDFEAAARAFARVDEPEAALNRGNALVMLGKYDDAIKSYDRALQFRPEWSAARENRDLAVTRRERMKPPADDAGGTGGKLAADEIVFDDRPKQSSAEQQIEVGQGDRLSDDELKALWLRRVETKPADFLRAKFAYQLGRQDAGQENSP